MASMGLSIDEQKAVERFKTDVVEPSMSKLVILDFYADWCGPCQMQLPVVEELSNKYADQVEVLKINVDEQPDIAQAFGVRSIPALFLLQNQQVVDKMVGYQSQQVLENKLAELAITA